MRMLALVLLAGCVHASRTAPPEPPKPIEEKSMGVAYAAALTGTVAGVGLLLSGGDRPLLGALVLTVAPSFGEIYAGELAMPFLTTSTRVLGGVIMLSELSDNTGCYNAETQMDESCPTTTTTKVGLGAFIAATVVDLIYTGFAVDNHNEAARASRVQLVPTANGVAIGGAF